MCDPLDVPDNGRVSYTSSEVSFPPYELETIAEYSCNIGYGFPVNMLVPVSSVCQSDSLSLNGIWVGAELTCSRKYYIYHYYVHSL